MSCPAKNITQESEPDFSCPPPPNNSKYSHYCDGNTEIDSKHKIYTEI